MCILGLAILLAACGGAAATPTTLPLATSAPPPAATVASSQAAVPTVPAASAPAGGTTASNTKAPTTSAAVCALLTADEAGAALGTPIDAAVPGTQSACNYSGGGALLLQLQVVSTAASQLVLADYKLLSPDAQVVPGIGDANFWAVNSAAGRFDILQGKIYFAIVVLNIDSGVPDAAKLLASAQQIAHIVLGRL
jgi:hypothetical protein